VRDLGAAAARADRLAWQGDRLAHDAEEFGELEPGDTEWYRQQAVELRRRAFTLRLQARGNGSIGSLLRRPPRTRRTPVPVAHGPRRLAGHRPDEDPAPTLTNPRRR
jgi:hypothetical protein